jgi:Restriction endonuclease BglII
MNCADLVPPDLHKFYDFREWRNPCAVLSVAFPNEWADILSVLKEFRIVRTDIGEAGTKGGGKSLVAIRMDQMFLAKGWKPMEFDTKIVVNERPIESPTHEVDC